MRDGCSARRVCVAVGAGMVVAAGTAAAPPDEPLETFVPPPATHPGVQAQVTASPAIQGVVLVPNVQITQVNVDALQNNIVGDAANEPSIAVNPLNHNQMVVGWRQFDSILSSFREAGVAFSTDGGQTWTNNGPIENGVFRSDPVLLADGAGVFYYNSLRVIGNAFDIQVFKSTTGGSSWGLGNAAFGGDKAWMAVDRSGGIGNGHLYQAWSVAGNPFSPATFTRSTDGGLTWSFPQQIPGPPIWGQLAVGPDGEVYVGGRNASTGSLALTRSDDAKNAAVAPTFTFLLFPPITGSLVVNPPVNPAGLGGQMNVAVDHSAARRGNVYVFASVNPFGADPLDVFFAKSTTNGVTWSNSIRINTDVPATNAYQWFGTMSVAPNGRIDTVWLDTRADPLNATSALYYAFSLNGGVTWSNNIQITTAFDHSLGYPQQQKMGDYFDMVSDDGGADLAMTATFNGEEDVYYVRINFPPCIGVDRDCNGNGIADDCDTQLGIVPDGNGNGIPDTCESPVCLADTNRDGVVDFSDVIAVLGQWQVPGLVGRVGDANGDAQINFTDVTAILGHWGATCP